MDFAAILCDITAMEVCRRLKIKSKVRISRAYVVAIFLLFFLSCVTWYICDMILARFFIIFR